MGLKADELSNPQSCLSKAWDDEPLFVIRAKDVLAVSTLNFWIQMADLTGEHEPEKIEEAKRLVDKMREWRTAHGARPSKERPMQEAVAAVIAKDG